MSNLQGTHSHGQSHENGDNHNVSYAGMPAVQPAAMPEQPLRNWAGSEFGPQTLKPNAPYNRGVFFRRWSVMLGFVLLAGLGAFEMHQVLSVSSSMTTLQWAMLILFISTFSWVALAAVTALAGLVRLLRAKPVVDEIPAGYHPNGKTAVLLPCYNEDSASIAASVDAMLSDLQAVGRLTWMDWFLLSDTRDPELALKEEQAVMMLRQKFPQAAIYYRRRQVNFESKAGNLKQFCESWGSRYDYLITLDADSLVAQNVLSALIYRLEHAEDVALIQSVPRLVNGLSLTARMQQFANAIYGPVVASGLAFWTNPEGNYWGHNAIIRRKAFMECAGLPHLPGKPPFGGNILSHDFVEAALLRRAGWKVLMADDLQGSYEEAPPSIIDLAIRDRRWCQGNMQHSKVLTGKGLHWVSRMHLLSGIMSYCSSVLWMALILVGSLLALQAHFTQPQYFTDQFSLFPNWPTQDAPRAVRLFILTMVVLLLPKLFGFILFVCKKEWRQTIGSKFKLALNILFETVLSIVVAPIMMCVHAGAVFSILLGHSSSWKPQRRQNGSMPFKDVVYRHRWHFVLGVVLTIATWLNSLQLLAWLSPTLFGLLLAAPTSAFTASPKVGQWFKSRGWMRTPEEAQVPEIVSHKDAVLAHYEKNLANMPPMEWQLQNADYQRQHQLFVLDQGASMFLPDAAVARVKILDARSFSAALESMTTKELSMVLATPFLFDLLCAKTRAT